MRPHPRYRIEDGVHCIDIRLSSVDQLFDLRDPAPFRERDLEPDLVEYVFAAAEDLVAHDPFKVVLWMPAGAAVEKIQSAYRAHFDYEVNRVDRRRARMRRDGVLALLIAVPSLVVFLLLARVAAGIPRIGAIAAEGIAIASWVVMWRPMETLFFDWIPLRRERRVYAQLRDSLVDIRV